jgi:hypothetical protein
LNYRDVLDEYKYESDERIKQKASAVYSTDYVKNRDIINEIILWKLNRSVEISDSTIDKIHSLRHSVQKPLDAIDNMAVKKLLLELLDSKGIKIAMASTILHFYYPSVFPIIDQRAYRELTGDEIPEFHTKDKNGKYAELYLHYIENCYKYNIEMFPAAEFECIDIILYQLDKDKNSKVKY